MVEVGGCARKRGTLLVYFFSHQVHQFGYGSCEGAFLVTYYCVVRRSIGKRNQRLTTVPQAYVQQQ